MLMEPSEKEKFFPSGVLLFYSSCVRKTAWLLVWYLFFNGSTQLNHIICKSTSQKKLSSLLH